MPDQRRHRGKHPDDDRLFSAEWIDALRSAVAEYSWLLGHGYATDSSLKLVGDRHGLTVRQRLAVQRSACSEEAGQRRRAAMIAPVQAKGRSLAIDGYNVLITLESALSDGMILVGRDGCYRDLASLHGTYRQVGETIPAVELLVDYVSAFESPDVLWLLDRPVSNSGRLKKRILEVLATKALHATTRTVWTVELVDSPDAVLFECDAVVATTDSVILDRCRRWINLAAEIIDARIPQAWKVDLRSSG